MARTLGILFGGLLIANSVFAQGMGGRPQEVFIPDVDVETFIWRIPSKWYPYSNNSSSEVDVYAFPTGQEPSDFKEMLHFKEYDSTMGVVEANSVYQLSTDTAESQCADYAHELEFDAQENGYSMAQWSENCTADDGSTVFALTKTVVGNEKLYISKMTWKFEPRESELRRWRDYLQTVYVCDPTTGRNECRPPGADRRGERPRR